MSYAEHGTRLVILAGKEYGSGSSRDWAAKGTALLGVRVVIAESYERIHRSNLIGMGVLPLQFPEGSTADTLGLEGDEVFTVRGITALNDGITPATVEVVAVAADGRTVSFSAPVRIDTPGEADYYRHGGILQYVLRSLLEQWPGSCPRAGRGICHRGARASSPIASCLGYSIRARPACEPLSFGTCRWPWPCTSGTMSRAGWSALVAPMHRLVLSSDPTFPPIS